MEMLEFDHNLLLVVMSFVIALAAGFTGLSLTSNLSQKSLTQKKISVALASIALGSGIWSMHFVAMLGLQLPVLFYYDAGITLISALVAILIVGVALILLHFTQRNRVIIATAGVLVGLGILLMHYIGMSGLELCRAIYTPMGIGASSIIAIAFCIFAFGIAYGHRNNRNIFLGTLCFATAVVSVHFIAMAGTNFITEPHAGEFGPIMSNETLALGVILSSFIIFGAFLWVSVTYLVPTPESLFENELENVSEDKSNHPTDSASLHIPCERDGNKIFVSASHVVLIRADGHYTQIYTPDDQLFCVWPITKAIKQLLPAGFIQTHRSYLVNPEKVSKFERTKDKGQCVFNSENLPPAPVSRSRVKKIQDALLIKVSATRAI